MVHLVGITLPLTTGNYSTNTSQLSINNSNSNINISVGNNSNQLSAGHNHPYLTSSSLIIHLTNSGNHGMELLW